MNKIFLVIATIATMFVNQLYAGYNQTDAAAYALTYAKNPNTTKYKYYPDSDCTNFVSQAMKAGGIKYDYNGNKEYKKWYKYSESWQWASTSRLRAYYGGYGAKKIRRDQLEVGDIIFFIWKHGPNRFSHAAMVTNVEVSYLWGTKYYYVSYHSRNRKNKPLEDVESEAKKVEYYRPRW